MVKVVAVVLSPEFHCARRDMNYNHLHYFQVIASEGSLARASKILGITQPTLSVQLKQLEDYFGAKLFDRTGGSLRLNDNGRRVAEVTHEMFRMGDRLEGLFPGGKPRIQTRLEIGISTTVARSFAMRRFLGIFADRNILTRVRLGDHEYLHHELLTSGLDLLITDRPPERPRLRGTVHRRLSSPEFVIICPRDKARDYSADFPLSLNRQPFVHYTTHSSYRFEIDQWFKREGIEIDVVAEADDVYLIQEAVAGHIGIGVVPRQIIDEGADSPIAVLGVMPPSFEIHAVYNRQDPTEQVLMALNLLGDPTAS